MLFLLSLVIRASARLLAGGRTDDGSEDLEILVLRHQLRVLRRKAGRPSLRQFGRTFPNTGPQRRPVLDEFTEFRRDAVEAVL